jgi:peptide deformylase
MVYPIVKLGDDILTTKTKDVTVYDAELQKFIDDMFESMYAANGVGLAANQIGFSRRMAVIDTSVGKDPKAKIVIINPEILVKDGKQFEEEGCLSIPGFRETVERPARAIIRAQNAKGKEFTKEGEGLLARAFCHETDHLNGMFFINHLSTLKRDLIKRKIRKMVKNGEW